MRVTVKSAVVSVTVGDIIGARGMTAIGNSVVALIRKRTTVDGESYTGGGFKPYSTRPIYITRGRGTGARLAPKGGRPTPSGQSVYYDGGYADYKRQSSGSSVVNLTLSGQLMRSIAVAKATRRQVVVQTGSGVSDYARGVNDARPFMGVSEAERPVLERVAQAQVEAHIRRAQAKARTEASGGR